MDYTINKQIDGHAPHVVYTFRQSETGSRAKQTAKDKLVDMWMRLLGKPASFRNLTGNDYEFSYDLSISTLRIAHVRFFIAPLKKKRGSAT